MSCARSRYPGGADESSFLIAPPTAKRCACTCASTMNRPSFMEPYYIECDATMSDAQPRSAYAHYVLVVLLLSYAVNFMDRNILNTLIDPIKSELHVSDTRMGLLVGFAFAIFNSLAGIPIARWADRGSRRSIIAMGMVLWCSMTALSGLART